jgi:hypothetical protein
VLSAGAEQLHSVQSLQRPFLPLFRCQVRPCRLAAAVPGMQMQLRATALSQPLGRCCRREPPKRFLARSSTEKVSTLDLDW